MSANKHANHDHSEHHHDEHHHGSHHQQPYHKRFHRDWRVWVGVILMLAAIMAYVLSDNEALRFGRGPAQPQMPAAN